MVSSTFSAFVLAFVSGAIASTPASVTPHEQFSSSAGVLGCKIDTNRVAYWPIAVDCNNICANVTANGRSVYLLHVDQSGGAYDISYDAWNFLNTGQSATVNPTEGNTIAATYDWVDPSNCGIKEANGNIALSAATAIDFLVGCQAQANSYVAQHHVLRNIYTSQCNLGYDEVCTLDLSVSNQPSCPHTLGSQNPLDLTVLNIQYGTGKLINSVTMQVSNIVTSSANVVNNAVNTVVNTAVKYMMEGAPMKKVQQKRWWDARRRND